MSQTFSVRYADGSVVDLEGIAAPVPGLAIIACDRCDCQNDLYAVVHLRSGSALYFSHSAEAFGKESWGILQQMDWSLSATELMVRHDFNDVLVRAAMAVPGHFLAGTQSAGEDMPEWALSGDR